MMNYAIRNIRGLKKDCFQNEENISKMKSLEEYLDIAVRTIKTFGKTYPNKSIIKSMLSSEDAISEVAMKMMIGDCRHDEEKGRTEHSFRNQCAIWAIKDYIRLFKTRANKQKVSLDSTYGEDDDVSLSSIKEDVLTENPLDYISNEERKDRVKKYVKFIMENSDLTEVQRKCLHYRYFYKKDGSSEQGIESYQEIGDMFEPKISRQAIKQTIDRSLYKLRMTAKGT